MKFICPLIVVEDIKKARKFYEEVLGQKVEFDFGENVQFHGPFAIHKRDHYQKLLSINTQKQITYKNNNMELYFESSNLKSIESRLNEEGIEFIHHIIEQPWGQRVMRFYDLDGHIIEVGESMDTVILRFYNNSMSVKEVSQRTSMPLDYIESLISKS